MEGAPIGVFALTFANFAQHGSSLVGPYLRIGLGVIGGMMVTMFGFYSLLMWWWGKKHPLHFFRAVKEPLVTAFVTRSSAAALPVSLRTAVDKLGIRPEIASFALPLGSTLNMDGVCVHLPIFAVLTANLFGMPLEASDLIVLMLSTVLAAVGTGGVPGGSLMLLFMILGSLGLNDAKTAIVVAFAMGINPLLDMFETMNNVCGDLVCAYLIDRDIS